ncbi:hypothetical protein EJ08DRAFT_642361 [Tothia fuscella]|uniref:F-box domain-containing protein n=1 Tax=Tothia fuscella TaxID=1048955 RepID=A0A9P4NFV3_9PEZI|nr:hypothetical protein EJ08DRAFT_642361 [Tothia fuscella]
MAKRTLEEEDIVSRPSKRLRPAKPDRLSALSDELLLRIFSNFSITTLNLCQRLSHKYCSIASDSQLWKSAYYNRFVRPRASRLPGIKDTDTSTEHLFFSSNLSKWLDEENLVKRGQETNWKRQYKLRHNWSKGSCDVSEIEVAEQPPIPPLLVRLHEGIVYTADLTGGLRAWTSRGEQKLLAHVELKRDSPPTSLALDIKTHDDLETRAVVGFEDGSFVIYRFRQNAGKFRLIYSHASSSNGMLSAVAFCSPYLVTMTAAQLLSLYKFPEKIYPKRGKTSLLDPPRILHSLHSHTVWPPLSLAIRQSSQNIIATIAYAIPTYISGWSVGIQELWLTPEGELLDSRLATSSSGSRTLGATLPTAMAGMQTPPSLPLFSAASPGYSKPTSLSYTHPYLLLSHPDNTLTLYLVNSTDRGLSVSTGSRLWGHTSSVSGAHVGGRGKAVSVSFRGDELRIWELEGTSARRKRGGTNLSVRIQPERKPCVSSSSSSSHGLGLALEGGGSMDDLGVVRGWVGFDEENVVVLKEGREGRQALVVYDFT